MTKRKWTADFETTCDKDDCRVWAYATCEIGSPENFQYGNSINEFMKWCAQANRDVYFHNLKFDGIFILNWLLTNGFEHIRDDKERFTGSFSSIILDTGQFYQITVYWRVEECVVNHRNGVTEIKKRTIKTRFRDSLKILNFSVDQIAKSFELPISKLTLDYAKKRPKGHKLNKHEIAYIRNDVEIMARALEIMFERNLTKMTIGGDALGDFRARFEGEGFNWSEIFPVLPIEQDNALRSSYKGGFTWLNPSWAGKQLEGGVVFDKNSMYPSIMFNADLPVGLPEEFSGAYKYDATYPLYFQFLSCSFKIKKGKIPTIQLKKSRFFLNNEYLNSSDDRIVTMCLAKPDLELFLAHYDVTNLTFQGGFKFRSRSGLFCEYIDYWMTQKIEAKKEGNKPLEKISKLLLNSLYGKFGTGRKTIEKIPYLNEDGVVSFSLTDPEEKDGVYLPVASFITAYARKNIVETSMLVRDWSLKKYGVDLHVYCDTDSIHIARDLSDEDLKELGELMDIDDFRLGAWKLESRFTRAKYLRQKCYIHEEEGRIVPTIAGFPKSLAPLVDFENFEVGFSTEGLDLAGMIKLARSKGISEGEIEKMKPKLRYSKVAGGVVLEDTDFTIK